MFELIVVGIAALLTSILSAVAGLGGGVVLLLVIAQFTPPTTAIPIQGAIQLVANGARAVLLRRSIAWPVAGWASLLLLPGSLVGVAIATTIPEDAVRVVLALFVLVLAWRPRWVRPVVPRPEADAEQDRVPRGLLVGLGAGTGVLNTTVGASGPVTSPFLKAVTASHVAFVATAAATQLLAHAAKLVAFTAAGWDITDHFDLIVVGVVGVVTGSAVGTRLLGRLTTEHLDLIFRVVLTTLAIRMLTASFT